MTERRKRCGSYDPGSCVGVFSSRKRERENVHAMALAVSARTHGARALPRNPSLRLNTIGGE